MDQETANRLAADMEAIRDQFMDAAEIAAVYGIGKDAVRQRMKRGGVVAVKGHKNEWLIPKAEAERVWGRWQGRR